MRVYITFSLLFITITMFGQAELGYIRLGNKQFDNKQYVDAEISYRKALDKNNKSFDAAFNIGDALYKQGKFDEAATQFGKLIENEKDIDKLERLYYNEGNSNLKGKKLEDCIDNYKHALKLNPKDMDSKSNLAYAQALLKKQKQQQKNDKNKNDQNKNDQNKGDQQKQQISQEDAQRILNAIQSDENNLQKSIKKKEVVASKKPKTLKNW